MNHQHQPSQQAFGSHSHHVVTGTDLSSMDTLFAMLDGQVIRGRNAEWRAEVVSILPEADATWVQIGPAQHPAMSVVLRLETRQRADLALEALRAWTDLPEERRPSRIDVGS